jgi:hypothetical protein
MSLHSALVNFQARHQCVVDAIQALDIFVRRPGLQDVAKVQEENVNSDADGEAKKRRRCSRGRSPKPAAVEEAASPQTGAALAATLRQTTEKCSAFEAIAELERLKELAANTSSPLPSSSGTSKSIAAMRETAAKLPPYASAPDTKKQTKVQSAMNAASLPGPSTVSMDATKLPRPASKSKGISIPPTSQDLGCGYRGASSGSSTKRKQPSKSDKPGGLSKPDPVALLAAQKRRKLEEMSSLDLRKKARYEGVAPSRLSTCIEKQDLIEALLEHSSR